jgi:hypothetical protein
MASSKKEKQRAAEPAASALSRVVSPGAARLFAAFVPRSHAYPAQMDPPDKPERVKINTANLTEVKHTLDDATKEVKLSTPVHHLPRVLYRMTVLCEIL